MGFFTRLSDIVSANINDILDRMEDPEKMMKQLVREMDRAVEKAKDELVGAITHERRVGKEIAARKKKIAEWHARAVEAVRKNRDDLARRALELKKESQDILAALEPELKSAQDASASMKTQLRALQAKCQEARRKEAGIAARAKTAKIRRKAAGGTRRAAVSTTAFEDFERMEDAVVQIESEAEAYAEVTGAEKTGPEEFGQWEAAREVDDELVALKKKIRKK